jgi:pimeloyl-ACP methyl ester carboxylesterase
MPRAPSAACWSGTPGAGTWPSEVEAALAAGTATDNDATEYIGLLCKGYFADPPSAPPAPPDLRMSLAANGETTAAALAELAGDFGGRLAGVHIPVRLVVGEASPLPPSVSVEPARLLPDAELTLVPGAGHLPWHEAPGCVADALAAVRPALG